MTDPFSDGDFAPDGPLAGWRVDDRWLRVRYLGPSFTSAGRFVAEVAAVADEVDHHPEVDLQYPGVVGISLTSHDVGRLTGRDRRLALRIVALAAAGGLGPTGP